eukprot:746648-Hanusia_phi.AAC.6
MYYGNRSMVPPGPVAAGPGRARTPSRPAANFTLFLMSPPTRRNGVQRSCNTCAQISALMSARPDAADIRVLRGLRHWFLSSNEMPVFATEISDTSEQVLFIEMVVHRSG